VIGLGLGDAKDITVRGLEIVKRAKRVYLEAYTAILSSHLDVRPLEEFYGREVILATRTMVEQQSDLLFEGAKEEDVAFLVVGDPLAATTHHDLITRAHELGIATRVVHNASIMNAVAACGLYLYTFGQTVSIPFFDEKWRPMSFYHKIATNMNNDMHTLCLLDIKVKEQSRENIARGLEIYEPPRYMTINQALEQLLEAEAEFKLGICTESSWAIGLARIGHDDQVIFSGTVAELLKVDFGGPLHSLVLPSKKLNSFEDIMIFKNHWDVEHREQRLKKFLAEKEAAMLREFEAQQAERRERERRAKEAFAKRQAKLAAQKGAAAGLRGRLGLSSLSSLSRRPESTDSSDSTDTSETDGEGHEYDSSSEAAGNDK